VAVVPLHAIGTLGVEGGVNVGRKVAIFDQRIKVLGAMRLVDIVKY
jgi:hypothetical protein